MNKDHLDRPYHDYYHISQLQERWGVSVKELLQYGEEGKLHFVVNWKQLRDGSGNVACTIDKEWNSAEIERLGNGFRIYSPCEDCSAKESEACQFDYSDDHLQTLDKHEFEKLNKVSITENYLYVQGDEVRRFDGEFGNIPEYLDQEHPCYSVELEAAIKAWLAICDEKKIKENKTFKHNVAIWLCKHYKDLRRVPDEEPENEVANNDRPIGRIATMLNNEEKYGTTHLGKIPIFKP